MTKMKTISEMVWTRKTLSEIEDKKQRRFYVRGTFEQVRELLLLNCKVILVKRRVKAPFVVDRDNQKVVDQLVNYAIGSDNFQGNRNLGILIRGGLGTGKTTLMKAMLMMFNEQNETMYPDGLIKSIHAKQLQHMSLEKKVPFFSKRSFFYDDIGKENIEIKGDYGKVIYPLIDIISEAYEIGTLCFFTTNYTFDTLGKWYGETTSDRIKEMVNVLSLLGGSRRQETLI